MPPRSAADVAVGRARGGRGAPELPDVVAGGEHAATPIAMTTAAPVAPSARMCSHVKTSSTVVGSLMGGVVSTRPRVPATVNAKVDVVPGTRRGARGTDCRDGDAQRGRGAARGIGMVGWSP